MKSYFTSAMLGLYYGFYIYMVDRLLHVGGPGNTFLTVVLSIGAALMAVGTMTVRKDSKYYLPIKWIGVVFGVIGGIVFIYAFFGTMTGKENFIQAAASSKVLPVPAQKILQSYVDFGKAHSVEWLPQPKPPEQELYRVD